jgi:hypothetical protein
MDIRSGLSEFPGSGLSGSCRERYRKIKLEVGTETMVLVIMETAGSPPIRQ